MPATPTQAQWTFAPAYRFYLYQRPTGAIYSDGGTPSTDGGVASLGQAFLLKGLVQIQASLLVQGGVNQLTATFADTNGVLKSQVNPQPMDQVQLWLQSRCTNVGPSGDGWLPAWTGYVDSVDHVLDPQQGSLLSVTCSSPWKLWEITLQEEGDAYVNYAVSTTSNIAGSVLLDYTANQVGYPTAMLIKDPFANSGSGILSSVIQGVGFNPELQAWGAVLQQYISSAGLEFFFNEWGQAIWRRVGFIGQTPLPRDILPEEILSATLTTSDQGLYTNIEVRPQFGGTAGGDQSSSSSGFYPAHTYPEWENTRTGVVLNKAPKGHAQVAGTNGLLWDFATPHSGHDYWVELTRLVGNPNDETGAMRRQIGRRFLLVYAPWILGTADLSSKAPAPNTQQQQRDTNAADYLAHVLGLQAAAGALHGQISLLADPQITIGSVIRIPALRQIPSPWIIDERHTPGVRGSNFNDIKDGSLYYVSSITYNLTWGGAWVMTLGLTYGRSEASYFPYLNPTGTSLRNTLNKIDYPVPNLQDLAQQANLGPGQQIVTAENIGLFTFTVEPVRPVANHPEPEFFPTGFHNTDPMTGKTFVDPGIGFPNIPPGAVGMDSTIFAQIQTTGPGGVKTGSQIRLTLSNGQPVPGLQTNANGYVDVVPLTKDAAIGANLVIFANVPERTFDVVISGVSGGSIVNNISRASLWHNTPDPCAVSTAPIVPSGTRKNKLAEGDLKSYNPQVFGWLAQTQPYSALQASLALRFALTQSGERYQPGHAGPASFDGPGLVAWSFAQVDIGVGTIYFPAGTGIPGTTYDTAASPDQIAAYFESLGAKPIAVHESIANAPSGDLFFLGDPTWPGHYSQVLFSMGKNVNYGAHFGPDGIGALPNAHTQSVDGDRIIMRLDMSTVKWPGSHSAPHAVVGGSRVN